MTLAGAPCSAAVRTPSALSGLSTAVARSGGTVGQSRFPPLRSRGTRSGGGCLCDNAGENSLSASAITAGWATGCAAAAGVASGAGMALAKQQRKPQQRQP